MTAPPARERHSGHVSEANAPAFHDRVIKVVIEHDGGADTVNRGSETAVTCFQRTLHACRPGVTIDGLPGTESSGAAGQADQPVLMAGLRSEATGEYRLLIACSAVQDVSQGGRSNRAYAKKRS